MKLATKLKVCSAALAGLTVLGASVWATADAGPAQWLSAGHDRNNTRFQPNETQISPATAGRLGVKWSFTTGGDVWATPAVDESFVYVPDRAGNLFKIDRESGAEVWRGSVPSYTGVPGNLSRTTPAIAGNKLILGDQGGRSGRGARVFAVNKNTGALAWSTVVDAHPAAMVTQAAVVHGNRIYVGVSSNEELFAAAVPGWPCCTFRGSVLALDANTGAILWKTYTVPNEPGYSGGAVWSSTPVVDPQRGSLYITTGNNYTVPQSILDCAALGDPAAVKACVDAVPGAAQNYFDAILSLDLDTGAVKWGRSMIPFDSWNIACIFSVPGNEDNCTDPKGPDYDFGNGAMLYKTRKADGTPRDLVAAGQKSGIFWAVDPDTGAIVWSTRVGPGGSLGGMQWGSATDGERIYAAVSNAGEGGNAPWALVPSGQVVTKGFWSALDPATGQILWQTAGTPAITGSAQGFVSVANGVVFGGVVDAAGTMYALDAATGNTLWTFPSGGSVVAGAAIADGKVYWGSGYAVQGIGLTPNNKLYAFEIK
jgi:polyvinyl alcohol dehydrogenase (cytochrome)